MLLPVVATPVIAPLVVALTVKAILAKTELVIAFLIVALTVEAILAVAILVKSKLVKALPAEHNSHDGCFWHAPEGPGSIFPANALHAQVSKVGASNPVAAESSASTAEQQTEGAPVKAVLVEALLVISILVKAVAVIAVLVQALTVVAIPAETLRVHTRPCQYDKPQPVLSITNAHGHSSATQLCPTAACSVYTVVHAAEVAHNAASACQPLLCTPVDSMLVKAVDIKAVLVESITVLAILQQSKPWTASQHCCE